MMFQVGDKVQYEGLSVEFVVEEVLHGEEDYEGTTYIVSTAQAAVDQGYEELYTLVESSLQAK